MTMTTIGLDLAKYIFQVHGVAVEGNVLEKRRLRRSQVIAYFASIPSCLIGMEACATVHFWARETPQAGACGPADAATIREGVPETR